MREIRLVEATLEKTIDNANDKYRNILVNSVDVYDRLPDWFYNKYYTGTKPEDTSIRPSSEDVNANINWKDVSPQDWKNLIDGKGMQYYNETLMNGFIDLFFEKWFEKNNIVSDNFKDAKNMLTRIVQEVGVDEGTNPFLSFLRNYSTNNNKGLNSNDLVTVNNAYADKILDFQDVAGNGHAKINNIIFNPDLYQSFNGEEQDRLVEIFEELSDNSYLSDLNMELIKDSLPEIQQYQKLKSVGLKDMDKRNLIMFEEGNPRGKIFPLQQIESAIQAGLGANYGENEKRPRDDRRDRENKLDSITKRDIRTKIKGLNKEDIISLFKGVLKDSGITIDDLR